MVMNKITGIRDWGLAFTSRLSSSPDAMIAFTRVVRQAFTLLGQKTIADTLSTSSSVIKIFRGLSNIIKLKDYQREYDGISGAAKIFLGFNFLAINPTSLLLKTGVISAKVLVVPLSYISNGLDIVERSIDISCIALKINILYGKKGQAYREHLESKIETHKEDGKAAKWEKRLSIFDLKKKEQFLNTAFHVSLLALHVLLIVGLAVPGLNGVSVALLAIGLTVTTIGLAKLCYSAYMDTYKEPKRNFKHVSYYDPDQDKAQSAKNTVDVAWALGAGMNSRVFARA